MPQTMNPNGNQRSRTIDRILHSRGTLPADTSSPSENHDTEASSCFVDSGGKPQMAFSLEQTNGEIDGFHYFNLDNIKFVPRPRNDYLSFDHRGKVVTLSGSGLRPIYDSIIRQTLVWAKEGGTTEGLSEETHINRIEITQIEV